MDNEEIKSTIKQYILQEFLPGESQDQLSNSQALVRTGILDSLATLKLVTFLEERFNIEFQAYETGPENLNTITDISNIVQKKLASKA